MNLQTRVEDGMPSSNQSMRIQIGDICCSITCSDRDVFSYLKELYSDFLSDGPADINIELEIVERLSADEIRKVMPHARGLRTDNRFTTTNLTLESEYDPNTHSLSMVVEKHLLNPNMEYKLMNRIVPAVYFTAYGVHCGVKPPAMIVHACGIARREHALIFTGPSETGKTTIAQLCGDKYGRILNDEMVLISWPDGDNHRLRVQGLPIVGGVSQRLNISAPLCCVLMLKQGKRMGLRQLDKTEAYLRFIRQVIAPAGVEMKEDKRSLLSLTTEFSNRVVRDTVFYELEFNLDREMFWGVIEELEKSLEKGVPAK